MARLVKPHHVEAALDALSIESARQAGKAKADEVRADENRKATLARLKRECTEAKSNADREDWARCQPAFHEAIEAYAKAAGVHEYHRDRSAKARAILEAWRTESADERAAHAGAR